MMTALLVALLVAQGWFLQLACAVTGEHPPRFGTAWTTAMLGVLLSTLASTAFGCTMGLLVSFFSSWLGWGLAMLVGLWVMAQVYKVRLRASLPQAVGIAFVHQILSAGLSALVWALIRMGWT